MKAGLMIAAAIMAAFGVNVAVAGAARPRVSMQAARASALSIVPHGQLRSGELETEQGRLIYSFDIQVPNRSGVEEVQISAIDGKLISRRHETQAAESREARAEAGGHKRR